MNSPGDYHIQLDDKYGSLALIDLPSDQRNLTRSY